MDGMHVHTYELSDVEFYYLATDAPFGPLVDLTAEIAIRPFIIEGAIGEVGHQKEYDD